MTSYETVFNRFLQKIEDVELASYSEDEQFEIMTGWLDSAISYIEFDNIQLVSDLSDRDNDAGEFMSDLSNFEIELISMYMVCAWLEPKINSIETYLLFVGASGEKWSDQNNRATQLRNMRDAQFLAARKFARNYGYQHSDYFEEEETTDEV